MAVLKLAILVLFCAIGFSAFQAGNLSPFAPESVAGITSGASLAFFSYIGFDAITTAGEEVRNPRRNIPIAIMVCIGVVTVLYCLVALSAIGALSADQVAGRPAALSLIVNHVTHSTLGGGVIAFGAVVAIASVVLAVMYGQTRILMSMSRDGLIPRIFERVSPRTSTPVANTWIVAAVFAVPAAVVPLDAVMNLSTIGTLAVMVGGQPQRDRCSAAPAPSCRAASASRSSRLSPVLGIAFCLYLIYGTGPATWLQFAGFLVVGALVYTCYGRRRSRLGSAPQQPADEAGEAAADVSAGVAAPFGSVNQTALPRGVGRHPEAELRDRISSRPRPSRPWPGQPGRCRRCGGCRGCGRLWCPCRVGVGVRPRRCLRLRRCRRRRTSAVASSSRRWLP